MPNLDFFSFLARISCIFIPGTRKSNVGEVLTGNLEINHLQNLNKTSSLSMHMVLHSNGTILLCGGFQNEENVFNWIMVRGRTIALLMKKELHIQLCQHK